MLGHPHHDPSSIVLPALRTSGTLQPVLGDLCLWARARSQEPQQRATIADPEHWKGCREATGKEAEEFRGQGATARPGSPPSVEMGHLPQPAALQRARKNV